MNTKKTKEQQKKPAYQSQKNVVGEDPLPGCLERDFRRILGRHNLHLNMLEMSAQTFANTLSSKADESSYVRDCAKKLGYHSLYPNTTFANARTYQVYSHISYVFSAGDMLCKRIRSINSIKALKKENEFLIQKIGQGDFVRRTLALTVLASLKPELRSAEAVEGQVKNIQTLESFALVNYYRLIRNNELHAADALVVRTEDARGALPEESIKSVYGMYPSLEEQINYKDALLCSKAWQSVSKWLCRHMLNDDDGQAILKERFGRLDKQRRNTAARKFLELELLYSKNEIDATLLALEW